MENLETIEKNAKLLLLKYPELRSPFKRKQAHWKFWQEYEGIEKQMGISQYIANTGAETISRAIRQIQKENPDLRPTKDLEIKKYEMAENYRRNYRNKENESNLNNPEQFSKLVL